MRPRALTEQSLKVVVLDIVRGELQRLPSNDLTGCVDLIFPWPLSFRDRKGVARLPLNFSFGQIFCRVVSDITKFDRVPQVKPLDRAFQHVFSSDTGDAIAG